MKSKDGTQRLRSRLEEALRENRRFRERIEVLASQNHHLRERVRKATEHPPEATAFEVIESCSRPRDLAPPETRRAGMGPLLQWYAADWFPVFENRISPLDPSPGFRNLTSHRVPIKMGFQLFGLSNANIEKVVSKVEERQLRDRDFIPVFVTNNCDFGVFRSRGYVFEYIPSSIANSPENQKSKRHILKDRLELIKAKWNLSDIVDLSG